MQYPVFQYFPPELHCLFQYLPQTLETQLQEIRLRTGRPIALQFGQAVCFLRPDGTQTTDPKAAVCITRPQMEAIFRAVCEYSVYRYQKEIAEGYLTIQGGHRVGICGTAVYRDGVYVQMRDISGINIRIARQVKGCAESLAAQTCGSSLQSVLLAGSVGSGKTTFLRDLCRILGQTYRLSVIDTRGEIAAVQNGQPSHEIGLHTDVYDGFPRAEGALMALRVMTPDGLVCDEISTEAEANALLQVHGCGVQLLATAHAGTLEELYQRPMLRSLLEKGVFMYIVLLKQGKVENIRRVAVC